MPNRLRKVHYRKHNSPVQDPVINQMNSLHNLKPHSNLKSILILASHLRLRFPRYLFHAAFPVKVFK
jgi:hypothetical protein